MYEQREKFISKYLMIEVFVVPVTFGAYPAIHYYGENPVLWKTCWMLLGAAGASLVLVPLIFFSLKKFYVYEDRIVIKRLWHKKQIFYKDMLKCYYKGGRQILCIYMADKEKKIPLGTYPEPVEIANNLARYIEVKDV